MPPTTPTPTRRASIHVFDDSLFFFFLPIPLTFFSSFFDSLTPPGPDVAQLRTIWSPWNRQTDPPPSLLPFPPAPPTPPSSPSPFFFKLGSLSLHHRGKPCPTSIRCPHHRTHSRPRQINSRRCRRLPNKPLPCLRSPRRLTFCRQTRMPSAGGTVVAPA